MDRTTRSSTSDDRKIEKNIGTVESGKMGSREKWECSDENPMYLDEHRKTASEMGTIVRYIDSSDVCGSDKSLKLGTYVFNRIYGRRSTSTTIHVIFVIVYILYVDPSNRG